MQNGIENLLNGLKIGFTLKTDNEDESTIKSTMRYTFCAPGAIGKGWGRGIRSLITKGKTLTKISLSSVYQPNDLVKQYIQEAETSSFGKERGKGLTGSTMCSGQVMGITMRKNSMVSENEYMQVDTPFSPSTNQVKQRTKEDETRVFKNSVGSNQGMRSMGNNPLILGKENMQTNISLPPSTNIVMKPSQTVEIAVGSSNPKNVKIVRGSNKCKEVSSLEVGQKLKVTFYNNRTVRKNSNLFLRHLGKIIRDSNMCPLSVSSWSDIKKQNLDHMWAAIKDKFESDDMNDHRDHIFGWMNELWNKWRGDLHSKYVKNKSMIHALKCKPQRVESREEGLGVMLSLLFKNNTSKKQKEYSKPS
ncbi:uncharacterized protein LOC107847476 isoform X4 [Capsicum annuum]|uniref:uncharacterized protein LOC107847476 isoform X4 n=1 Tax=Capsicum annuum TaxID=4072 RepID=UPI001FB0DF39|nr:uncharacterized protein LOC107847476 isoform X4 [Capsicum annuum]XP_047254783.1 uncharacterized protein LOC107847476 isoform X4 [Capsicum annuum]XP_047254784.1 uncharacterized protein LOC107847476 isoform X4 [Capsicum annuum]XP_047254785.1 uncharacterized protein LOC107847476 isoform X4 [Capsicum annuum]